MAARAAPPRERQQSLQHDVTDRGSEAVVRRRPGSQRGTEGGTPPEAVAVALSKLAGDRGQDRDRG